MKCCFEWTLYEAPISNWVALHVGHEESTDICIQLAFKKRKQSLTLIQQGLQCPSALLNAMKERCRWISASLLETRIVLRKGFRKPSFFVSRGGLVRAASFWALAISFACSDSKQGPTVVKSVFTEKDLGLPVGSVLAIFIVCQPKHCHLSKCRNDCSCKLSSWALNVVPFIQLREIIRAACRAKQESNPGYYDPYVDLTL